MTNVTSEIKAWIRKNHPNATSGRTLWEAHRAEGKPFGNIPIEVFTKAKGKNKKNVQKEEKVQVTHLVFDSHEVPRTEFLEFVRKEKHVVDVLRKFPEFLKDVNNIHSYIAFLRDKGTDLQIAFDHVMFEATIKDTNTTLILPDAPDGILKIGYVSDLHYLCKKCKEEEIEDCFNNWFRGESVDFVLNSGDTITGWEVYDGQKFEVKRVGADEQVAYVADKYPLSHSYTNYGRKLGGMFGGNPARLVNFLITGNHEESIYKHTGVKVGTMLQKQRPDLVCIGGTRESIQINGAKIMLYHGAGGSSYAMSYKPQKFVDGLPHGSHTTPDIVLMGHWHIDFCINYSDIWCIAGGAFQGETKLTKRLNLTNRICAKILEIPIRNGVAITDELIVRTHVWRDK